MALASNALTTIATLESVLGLASGSADTALTRAINEASAIADSYAGRVFYRQTAITEKHVGLFGPILTIKNAPLNSITSVSYLGTAVDSSTYEIHDANVGQIYRVSGTWEGVESSYVDSSGTLYAGAGRKVWTIVYDGGWYTPNQASGQITRNLPYDIEQAAIAIAIYLYRAEARDPTLSSESLMDASQSYATSSLSSGASWLDQAVPGAAAILRRYRRGFFG